MKRQKRMLNIRTIDKYSGAQKSVTRTRASLKNASTTVLFSVRNAPKMLSCTIDKYSGAQKSVTPKNVKTASTTGSRGSSFYTCPCHTLLRATFCVALYCDNVQVVVVVSGVFGLILHYTFTLTVIALM